MRAPTHMLGGAAAWLGICAVAGAGGAAQAGGVVAALMAAPWCDADNLGAWAKRRPRRFGIRRHRRPVKYWAARALSVFGTHRRGPAHSLAGTAAFAMLWWAPLAWWAAWPPWLAPAVLTGLWSHLCLDLANEAPVGLLWPSRGMVHGLPPVLRCRVGGAGETVWAVALAAALAAEVLH